MLRISTYHPLSKECSGRVRGNAYLESWIGKAVYVEEDEEYFIEDTGTGRILKIGPDFRLGVFLDLAANPEAVKQGISFKEDSLTTDAKSSNIYLYFEKDNGIIIKSLKSSDPGDFRFFKFDIPNLISDFSLVGSSFICLLSLAGDLFTFDLSNGDKLAEMSLKLGPFVVDEEEYLKIDICPAIHEMAVYKRSIFPISRNILIWLRLGPSGISYLNSKDIDYDEYKDDDHESFYSSTPLKSIFFDPSKIGRFSVLYTVPEEVKPTISLFVYDDRDGRIHPFLQKTLEETQFSRFNGFSRQGKNVWIYFDLGIIAQMTIEEIIDDEDEASSVITAIDFTEDKDL